ncbi:ubiquinol-cytochrome c reductase iron-sulfur subunit [Suttonella sp. R2A3]|uniref:ubiquinol-cytochrome c reductase iron-sulfur subunit n=1 Tax=Suttonella sp. R2A3 TaxID=2908648 RepID=UPI001F2C44F8|nr:ubiquinol-cytochrome c reductase iron-sulfur subunit [Suttonella sp. R2A3]UJF24564.1 ubiquinol-cytochrome c reductase iron-sulfur subunit [Suttonella sp. R2A3]
MSNVEANLKPAFEPGMNPDNPGRRKMLIAASTGVSAVGAAFVAVPFLSSWLPSERAKAIGAPVAVDITKLKPGAMQTTLWQGKVVFVLRRTEEMLGTLSQLDDVLRDPNSDESLQPEFAKNEARAQRDDVMVMLGICTHLGCAPLLQTAEEGRSARGDSAWLGGFFCPCHGSKFDYAGRVYKGVPAPTNLVVPPYQFDGENVVVVGAESEGGA